MQYSNILSQSINYSRSYLIVVVERTGKKGNIQVQWNSTDQVFLFCLLRYIFNVQWSVYSKLHKWFPKLSRDWSRLVTGAQLIRWTLDICCFHRFFINICTKVEFHQCIVIWIIFEINLYSIHYLNVIRYI